MNALILGSLLFSMEYSCQSTEINETDVCPLTEEQWKTKEADIKCGTGEGYFCSLNENNAFITGCLPPLPIAPETVGCPFVVTATQLLIHEGRYTPCNTTFVGCPPKDHPGYTIAQFYKYPRCLIPPKERYKDFTVLHETTTERNAQTSNYPITSDTGSEEGLGTPGIIGVTFAVFVSVIGLLIGFVVYFVRRKRRRNKKKVIICASYIVSEEEKVDVEIQDLDGSSDPLLDDSSNGQTSVPNEKVENGTSKTSTVADNTATYLDEEGEKSDDDEGEGDDEEEKEEEERSSRKGQQQNEMMHQNIELSFFDKCCGYVKEGSEEILRQMLGGLNKDDVHGMSVSDVKKLICLWVKMHDKPNFLEIAVNFLSKLDETCCLENLELMPENYATPVALLLYAGKMEQEKTVKYLLQQLKCIDHTDKEEKTILHYCVLMGSKDLTEEVIEKDKSLLNKCNIDERSAFRLAVKDGRLGIAELLLEKGATVQDENCKFETIVNRCLNPRSNTHLHLQWKNVLRKALKSMHLNNTSVQDLGKVFRALMWPFKKEHSCVIEEALALFPDMLTNSDYFNDDHPLTWALKLKPKKTSPSSYILDKMSDEDLLIFEDSEGLSVLHVGIKYRSLVKNILRRGVAHDLVNKVDRENNTPIMYAVKCTNKLYFSILLQHSSIDLINTNCEGKNLLHLVVEKNWLDQCKEILRGRDNSSEKILNDSIRITLIKAQDTLGKTPLMQAVTNFLNVEMLHLLLEEGSELLQMDRAHKTVFHHLMDRYNTNMESTWATWTRTIMSSAKYRQTKYLLKVKDSNGQSPLDIALRKGCKDLLQRIEGEVDTEQSRQRSNS